MSRPILALDSSVFRAAGDDRLRDLRRAGYDLRVSIIAFAETWARALRDLRDPKPGKDPEGSLRTFKVAALRLKRHSREDTPIEPALDYYVLAHGRPRHQILGSVSAEDLHRQYESAWEVATDPNFDRARLEEGAVLVESIRGMRERWKHFCRTWRERAVDGTVDGIETKAAPAEKLRVLREANPHELVPILQSVIADCFTNEHGLPSGWVAGLDAFTRLMAFQAIHGGSGARPPGHHDGPDAHQLPHLAAGAIVVTRDQNFIDEVDRCGTRLAPWVCTDEQILRAPPPGRPDDARARESGAGFVRLRAGEATR
jgi:hypothetical protein